MTLLARLKDKILHHPSGCWVFAGTRSNKNYGQLRIGPRGTGLMLAHRASYECFVGPVPPGMWVLHRCDNPACVNPEHLFLGTSDDNIADMEAKGRRRAGKWERHRSAKLTQDIVRECRRLYALGGVTHQQLADRFGVAQQTMFLAVSEKTWRGI